MAAMMTSMLISRFVVAAAYTLMPMIMMGPAAWAAGPTAENYHDHLHRQLTGLGAGGRYVEARSSCVQADEPYVAPPRFEGCRLQYYVQVLVGDPSLNQMFLPPLNASHSGLFGHGELFAFNATSGRERDSRLLGYVRGFTIDSSYILDLSGNSIDLVEVEYISYDDGVHRGTLHIQGEIKAQPTNEVAIVGGTGSFRGARGYAFISRLLLDGNYRLFHHDVRFLN